VPLIFRFQNGLLSHDGNKTAPLQYRLKCTTLIAYVGLNTAVRMRFRRTCISGRHGLGTGNEMSRHCLPDTMQWSGQLSIRLVCHVRRRLAGVAYSVTINYSWRFECRIMQQDAVALSRHSTSGSKPPTQYVQHAWRNRNDRLLTLRMCPTVSHSGRF
jgi:hypothetical protein